MSTVAVDTLNDLIEILRDGQSFYDAAAPKVDDPTLQALFRDASTIRYALIVDLADEIAAEGREPSASGTLAGSVREAYAQVLAALSSDKNTTFVKQLEAAEDRLLHAFERALGETESSHVRHVLAMHLPKVQKMHNAMSRQKSLRAA